MRVIDLLIPGACPEMHAGPPSLWKGEQRPYITTYGALPPHWSEERCLEFECRREDAVMIRWRHGSTKRQMEAAARWLIGHGLDNSGRPKVWDRPRLEPITESDPESVPVLALAG